MMKMNEHDYPEDEGEIYQCHCINCFRFFYGHKRRIRCKLCVTKKVSQEQWDKLRSAIDRIVHGDGSPSNHTLAILEQVRHALDIEVDET